MADVQALVAAAAAEVSIPMARTPPWGGYSGDFHAGIPLLRGSPASVDLDPAVGAVVSLVERVAARSLPGHLAEQIRDLSAQLHDDPDMPRRAAAWLLDKNLVEPKQPGLLKYLGWTVLAAYLFPVTSAFGRWRDEERWLRNYCPTCGAPPAMAQLVGADPASLRLLSCGHCGTRWRFRRTGCPFCENQDNRRLTVLTIEGESGLRIDSCETCLGYLKTYSGEGNEDLLLADWTSLHLDVIAIDRGLKRLAASLYELEAS